MIGTAFLGSTYLSLLPETSIHDSDGTTSVIQHRPAVMSADKLFIRIGNGILRGSVIRAKMLEMMVSGNLTIESLEDTFISDMTSKDVAIGIGALFGEINKTRLPFGTMDSRLGAVSAISFVEEDVVHEKIEHLASIIGYEKFYLKVGNLLHTKSADIGLRSEGLIVRSKSEQIEAGKRLDEEVQLENKEKRRVINPTLGELIAAATQIDEFNKVRSQIELDMRVRSKDSIQVKKVLDSVKKSDIEKVASIKQRILNTQKKVALKTKEIAQKTSQIKMSEHTTQRQLQA
jgi:hypothetical protein